jgi:hypothetical protein
MGHDSHIRIGVYLVDEVGEMLDQRCLLRHVDDVRNCVDPAA